MLEKLLGESGFGEVGEVDEFDVGEPEDFELWARENEIGEVGEAE